MKPLSVNLPYPSLDGITEDKKSAIIVSSAYAGSHGELNATLQYVYHYFNFNAKGEREVAKTLMEIALSEMFHLEILGEVLLRLGVDPVFTRFPPYKSDYYATKSVSYSKSASKMIIDDISGELVAINNYEQIIRSLVNEKVEAVIARIKLDEELHVKALKELYSKVHNDL